MIRRCLFAVALTGAPVAAFADPSLECSIGAGSQVEIADCLIDVEETATEALRIILDEARSAAIELDEVTEREVAGPALEASQNAWLALQEAHCAYEGALFGGGSGTGIGIRSCRIEMIRDRIRVLESNLY